MALLSIANLYQFRVAATIKGEQNHITTIYYECTADPDPVTETTVEGLNLLITHWQQDMLPLLSPTYKVWRYELRGISSHIQTNLPGTPGKFVLASVDTKEGTSDDVGTVTYTNNEILPASNCVVITAGNSSPGRGSRTAWRMGPVVEDQQIDGFLEDSNDGLTDWTSLAGQMVLAQSFPNPSDTVLNPVHLHRKKWLATADNTTVIDPAYISSFSKVDVNTRIRQLVSRRGPVRGGF